MCTVHPKGDDFDQMVPFWFDAEVFFDRKEWVDFCFIHTRFAKVLFDGKDAQKVQFVKSGRSHCESFPANAKHQFWRYTFKEHTGGLSFKCLLDKDPVIADSSDEEEEEQVQEETGKRRKSSDSSSTKKKRGRRRKSVDVDVAAVAAAASPAAAKIASSPAASSPIARTPLTQEEALRVVNELERKVKELCDDARNRINGGVKK